MLGNVRVREEITRLKQERFAQSLLTESDIFQKFMDIAFVDITDYLDFGQETVPVMGPFGQIYDKDPDTGEKMPITKIINAVRFKESREIDGTILAEVKQGRDGASIKLADRMRALEWLADHLNMATSEQKAKVAKIYSDIETSQRRLEIDLIKAENGAGVSGDEVQDDNFIQALSGEAAEVWTDGSDED